MKLTLPEPYGNTATDAFRFARERGILPTWMGTAELDELEAAIKERAVFSARTTNAVYLDKLREQIGRLLADGYNGDQAQLRLELKQWLAVLGYDPETGFPGDDELGIPPARAGSLQDLSSDRRINLILDTQLELMAGKGQEQRGLSAEALDLYPAWELVRVKSARVPRDWFARWKQAGARMLEDADGRKRLVAHKRDEVWSVLGDRAIFRDALGVSHPPFAFGSGMAWQAIDADEWERLKGSKPDQAMPANVIQFPPAQISTSGLSRATVERLAATMKDAELRDGTLTLKGSLDSALARAQARRAARANALCDGLDCLLLLSEINGKARRKGNKYSPKAPGKKCGNSWISSWKRCDSTIDEKATEQQIKRDENHRIQPKDWEEHHPRSDARRAGDAGEDAARRILPRHYEFQAGASARAAGAEIAAVARGRKPLFHEQWGDASAPMAAAMQGKLPKGVHAEAFDGHLVVYRESVVSRVMDSDPGFYKHDKEGGRSALRRVVKDQAMGELLGYGQRTLSGGGRRVIFFTKEEGVLAGFISPAKGGEAFMEARRADYQRRMKRPVQAAVL